MARTARTALSLTTGAAALLLAVAPAAARDAVPVAAPAQDASTARGHARFVIDGDLLGRRATVTLRGVSGPATGQVRTIRTVRPRTVNLRRLPAGRWKVHPTALIAPGHRLSLGRVARRFLTVRPGRITRMPLEYVSSVGVTPGSPQTIEGVRLTVTNDWWSSITAQSLDPYDGTPNRKAQVVTLARGESHTWSVTSFQGDWVSGAKTLCLNLDGASAGLPFVVCGTNPVIGKPKIQLGVTWLEYWDGGKASEGGFYKWRREWGESFPLAVGQSTTRQLDLKNDGAADPFPGSQWTLARAADSASFKNLSIRVSPIPGTPPAG